MTTRFTGEDPDFGTTTEDMNAVNDYMQTAPANTPAAQKIKSDWASWWNDLNFLDKMSDAKFDEARTRRNQFWLANATTQAQKANVINVMQTGITTEEMQGKLRPAIDIKTGAVGSQVKNQTASNGGVVHTTIRQGSKGADVKAWQAIIGVNPDGNFGPATTAATKAWQSAHGVTADGVVGVKTWQIAIPTSGPAADPAFNPVANPSLVPPTPGRTSSRVPAAATAAAASTAAAKQAPLINPNILSGTKVAAASVIGGLDVTKWGWKQWLAALVGTSAVAAGGAALAKHHEVAARRR